MIDLVNLSVQFSGKFLFENVNLKILPNDRIALVGSNGTGKSTLLKIISGLQNPEDGQIQLKKGIQIGYLPQELMSSSEFSIIEDVRKSIKSIHEIESEEKYLRKKFESIEEKDAELKHLLKRTESVDHKKEQIGYYELDSKIEKILTGLGFKEEDFSRKTSDLSGGWQMRVEMAKILVSDNDIILLDEPTNHLDLDSLRWLIKFLENFRGAIILVSHDRYFVNKICEKTLEIYNKDVTFFKGSYQNYLSFKNEREERLKLEIQEQQKKIKQTEEFIDRFRYKATKAKQVQSRIKNLEKIDRIKLADKESKINFRFFETTQSGVLPLKINGLSKSYGDNIVLENINLQIERGEKIAFVGPNGAGKTTFAKLLSNRLDPDCGTIETAHNTIISYYAQDVVDNLNLENDILTEISQGDKENTALQLRTLLGAFLFHGDDVKKKISVLSGGEKSRVALVKVLLTKSNTIILDEPTNHLDFESKKIVQNALMNFSGTIIIVSHDIDFLKPIATKVIEFRNRGIKEFYGGIEYYLDKIEERESEKTADNKDKESSQKLNRKAEKRIEAEKRQNEYSMTKDLKLKISQLEKLVEKLEIDKEILQTDFTKPDIYSNPVKAKENRQNYERVSNELEKYYEEWSIVSEELEKIQSELD